MYPLFEELSGIPGITLVPSFLPTSEELLREIDAKPWLSDLSRRVQHHGWKYDYRSRSIGNDSYLGPLPDFLRHLAERLSQEGLMSSTPDQAIINEYLPGQGIAAHIDCEPCFGPEIATISLGDAYPMRFTNIVTGEGYELWLPVGSVCVIGGEARYDWKHEIVKRKSDAYGAGRKLRGRRVSVTFRNVIKSSEFGLLTQSGHQRKSSGSLQF